MSSSIVLICAVLASLAAGVLVAYGACQALFALFQTHARQIAQNRPASVIAPTPAAEI